MSEPRAYLYDATLNLVGTVPADGGSDPQMSDTNERHPPALSPEEWAEGYAIREGWVVSPSAAGCEHAQAAFDLKGMRFGFTWQDVDDELRAAEEVEARIRGPFVGDSYPPLELLRDGPARAARHRDRAARIAAIIPPRRDP